MTNLQNRVHRRDRRTSDARKAAYFFAAEQAENCAPGNTIGNMSLASLGIRILESMFFVGLLGSTVVVIISFFEDAKELFGEE